MRLKSVCINEKEQIFLDGIEVNDRLQIRKLRRVK